MTPLTQHRARIRLLFTILLTVSSCFALSLDDTFGQRFDALNSRFKSSNAPAKAVLLDQMDQMRDYLNDADTVGTAINRIANDSTQSMLIRDEANWHRARIALHERRLADVGNIIEGLGYIRDWGLADTRTCKVKRLEPGSALRSNPLGTVSIYDKNVSICAIVAVYSSSKKGVALRFGSNVFASIYINGALAKSVGESDFVGFDQHSVGVSLLPGWNTVAIELTGKKPVKQFAIRVTNPDGGGISFDADYSRVGSIKTAFANRVFVSDLLSMAEQGAASKSPESLDSLTALQQLRGIRPDFKQLESFAQLSPSADRWMAVAHSCPDQACTLSALSRAVQTDNKNVPARTALADYYVRHNQAEKARNLLKDTVALDPSNFAIRKRLADVYASQGKQDLASSEFKQLEAIHSTSLWLRRELALQYEATGNIGQASSLLNQVWKSNFDDAQVRAALERLAEQRHDFIALQMLAQAANIVDPADPVAKLDIAKYTPAISANVTSADATAGDDLTANSTTGQLIRAAHRETIGAKTKSRKSTSVEDTEYFVNAAQLAADARKTVPQENSNVIVLSDSTVERLRDNGQSVIHAQQVFYMANDRGARDYGTRSVQFSSATQNLETVVGRIYKADGRIVEAEDQGETAVTDNSNSMYFDTRAHTLRFPGLEKGDVMELEYRIVPNSSVNPYGNYFGALITFQTGLPQRLHRYVFIAPSDRRLNIDQERMPTKGEALEVGDRTVYQWDATDLKPLVTEPRGPSHTEIAPYVSISTIQNWDDFGRWYASIIAPQMSLDAELREALATATAGSKTEREKIQAIYEFVIRNTHYVAMEFGVYSYKPYPVTQVYARRFGDCKDKASLMIAMLREAGIDAELALIRTRKLGEVSDRATALSVFNHAIVYIPKYDLWLDGTAEYAGSRELPLDDQGAMALTVNLNGTATLRHVPGTLPMQNYTHRVVRAQIETDGKLVFKGSAYTRGEDAPGLRREYELAARQKDTVRANLAQVYPSVKIEAVQVEGAHDIEHDVNVNFSGSLETFKGQKAFSLEPSWLPHRYVNSLAPSQTRSQDLQLPAPWTTEEELHFAIPDGAKFESLPKNLRYDTPFGTAVIRYEHHEHELTVSTSVQFRKLRIAPADYAAFREFCDNVEKAFHQEIKVRLAG